MWNFWLHKENEWAHIIIFIRAFGHDSIRFLWLKAMIINNKIHILLEYCLAAVAKIDLAMLGALRRVTTSEIVQPCCERNSPIYRHMMFLLYVPDAVTLRCTGPEKWQHGPSSLLCWWLTSHPLSMNYCRTFLLSLGPKSNTTTSTGHCYRFAHTVTI